MPSGNNDFAHVVVFDMRHTTALAWAFSRVYALTNPRVDTRSPPRNPQLVNRTVSQEAVLIRARTPPIQLLALEGQKIHEGEDRVASRQTVMGG